MTATGPAGRACPRSTITALAPRSITRGKKVVAIERLSAQGDERVAAHDGARIRHEARDHRPLVRQAG